MQFLRSEWLLCQWSMKRMHTHTYPWIQSLQTFRATVDKELLISEMDAHPACQVELLLWLGRDHTWEAKCMSWDTFQHSPGAIHIGTALASTLFTGRDILKLTAHSKKWHIFFSQVYFHFTSPFHQDETRPLPGRWCHFLGALSWPTQGTAVLRAVVHQPWSTQDSWWLLAWWLLQSMPCTPLLAWAELPWARLRPFLPLIPASGQVSMTLPERCAGLQIYLPQGISWPWCCWPVTPSSSNLQWLLSYMSLESCQALHPQTFLHP